MSGLVSHVIPDERLLDLSESLVKLNSADLFNISLTIEKYCGKFI